MNKRFIIALLVLVGLFAGLMLTSKPQSDSGTKKLTFGTVSQDVNKGAVLYDVRTPDEFKKGYYKGAINYPLQTIQSNEMPKVSKTSKIYLYCNSGSRSAQASLLLKDAGYKNVIDLGGLSDVKSIGGQLITK